MKVADIMTLDVVTIRNSATVAEAVKLMRRHDIQALKAFKDREYEAWCVG